MVALAFRFDLGRYHANPWGTNVNDAATEWPPSPWRILRALYSVARTNVQLSERGEQIDAAIARLAAAPPPVYRLPGIRAGHTRHYMPHDSHSPAKPKTDRILDGFLALSSESEVEVWWDAQLPSDELAALQDAAGRLAYLGRSESVCTARVVAEGEPASVDAHPLADDETAGAEVIDLLCVDSPNPLAALATSVPELRARRTTVPQGCRRIPYSVAQHDAPSVCHPAKRGGPEIAVLRVTGGHRPALHDAVAMGQMLRSALQSRYGSATDRASSPTFSGRDGNSYRRDDHSHAHFLSLPDEHGRRIGRVVVWAPEGLGDAEVTAIASLRRVSTRALDPDRDEQREIQVTLAALGSCGDLVLPELLGEHTAWTSVTPFGLVRFPKRRASSVIDGPEDQVRRELAHRRMAAPAEVIVRPGPWHRFRSHRIGQARSALSATVGITIHFDEPVAGPIALGRLSHYGLGLFRPD